MCPVEGSDLDSAATQAPRHVGTHAAKAGTRALINTSPEPFSNWTASITEDLGVIGGLWLALNHPILFLIALALFILLLIWLLPKLWRGIKSVFSAIGRLFGGGKREPEPDQDLSDPERKQ